MKTLSIASAILIASALAAFSQSQLAPLPPDGFVTLQQIVQDFTNQPDDALQKYNGMRICVYGRIGKVEQSDDDDADPLAVTMQLQNQTTPAVKAYFDQDDIPGVVDVVDDQNKATIYHRDWAGNLSQQKSFLVGGENAAIRGTFDNFVVGDIVLKNSFKLSPEALSQKLSEHGISTE
ncbi:MAG: hypothetical protein RL630_406 [Verrucomicrobiota bacterium]|jgi:hypothetical protein